MRSVFILILTILCTAPLVCADCGDDLCSNFFPSTLQNTSDAGSIVFQWETYSIDDPDNALESANAIQRPDQWTGTCGTTTCTSLGAALPTPALKSFKTTSSKTKVKATTKEAYLMGVTSDLEYKQLYGPWNTTISDVSTSGSVFIIKELKLDYAATLNLKGGNDYWIERLNVSGGITITVSGNGTARVFVKNSFEIDWDTKLNMDDSADRLLIIGYGDANYNVGSTHNNFYLYSAGNITLGSNSYITGGLASDGNITVGSSRSEIHYDSSALSYLDSRGFCYCNEGQEESDEVLTYYFDESSWVGATEEVRDSSGNGHDGQAVGASTSSGGQTCRNGVFDGQDDYVIAPGLSDLLNSTASLIFWVRTNQTGDNTSWRAPGIAGIEVVGSQDDMTWGWLDASGHIGLDKGDTFSAKSVSSINDGQWHHIALTRDSDTGIYTIYVDGVLEKTGTIAAGVVSASYESIGRIEDSGGTPVYFKGDIDEVHILNGVVSQDKVIEIMSESRPCDSEMTCFYDDFNRVSLGSDWATSTSSGSFGSPRIIDNRLRLTNNAANVATATTLKRLFPAANNIIIYDFDYYAYSGSGADGISIALSDASVTAHAGAYGGSLGYAQRSNISGFAGGWLSVGIDEYGNYSNPTEGRHGGPGFRRDAIAIRGSGAGLTGYPYITGTNTLTPGLDFASSSSLTTGHHYRVTVDHSNSIDAIVSVERDAGSGYQTVISETNIFTVNPNQAPVPTNWLLSLTGSTGGSVNIHEIDNLQVCSSSILPLSKINHYRIYHDGEGLTCSPEAVIVKACLDEECTVEMTGDLSIKLSPDGWSNGIQQTIQSGDTVYFRHTDIGSALLRVSGASSEFEATNSMRCFIGGVENTSCSLNFVDSGFVFDIPDHVSGNVQSVILSAVKADDNSELCLPGFSNTQKEVVFSQSAQNPLSTSSRASINGIPLSESGQSIKLDFNSEGKTTLLTQYVDVGQLLVSASYVGQGDEAGLVMYGNDQFIAKPARFVLSVIDNPGAESSSGPVFKKAGEPFKLQVNAQNSLGQRVKNFGHEIIPEEIGVKTSLIAPVGQHNPQLVGEFGTAGSDCSNVAMSGVVCGEFSWGEVGIVAVQPYLKDGDYLRSGDISESESVSVGRFIPDHFQITANTPEFIDRCVSGEFSYIGDSFGYLQNPKLAMTAVNKAGGITENYASEFWKYSKNFDGRNYADSVQRDLSMEISVEGNVISTGIEIFDGTANFAIEDEEVKYVHTNIPVNAFIASVDLTFPATDLTDTDGVCFDENSDGSCDSFTIQGIAGSRILYGRLNLENAYGSELEDLEIPLQTEFYEDSYWVLNASDNCTSYHSDYLFFYDFEEPLSESNISVSGGGYMDEGYGLLMKIASPGEGIYGQTKSYYDLDAAGMPWLKHKEENPTGVVSFGIYQGDNRFIFVREMIW